MHDGSFILNRSFNSSVIYYYIVHLSLTEKDFHEHKNVAIYNFPREKIDTMKYIINK